MAVVISIDVNIREIAEMYIWLCENGYTPNTSLSPSTRVSAMILKNQIREDINKLEKQYENKDNVGWVT